MRCKIVAIPTEDIIDWPSFHEVFQKALGFPTFYGRNMNAWIDCMTSIDAPEHGMSTVKVESDELLVLSLEDAPGFQARCQEQYKALLECLAFVNYRRIEAEERPVLALMLAGHFQQPAHA
jgi:hypothetical protein